MSLLDDIHQKADEKREQLSESERLAYQQEQAYLQHINPRFKKFYSYFNELINELNFLDEKLFCAYRIPGADIQKDFYHGKYSIAANSSDRMTDIKISFICQREKPVNFISDNDSVAQRVADELHQYQLKFHHRPHTAKNGRRAGSVFEMEPRIAVFIRLFLVPGSIDIRLETHNIPILGKFSKTYRPHEIDDSFMEQLGLFMLRRENSISRFELPAENRQVIQENIKKDKAERRREAIENQLYNPTLGTVSVQENKAPKPGLLKRLFGRN